MTETSELDAILSIIKETGGVSDRFVEKLRQNRITHLSFSQISAVEFCHHRYHLQYVQLVDPMPLPDYFTKGKLLHQMIAMSYECVAHNMPIAMDDHFRLIDNHYQDEHQKHLRNAVLVHLENLWKDCEIVAIEEPFAMLMDPELPPVVGIIDLVLKRNGTFILIDHKTGRDFYPQDELQMAIYRHFIQDKYGADECQFYYDNYRWVNNLGRIRKPAFQRVKVTLPALFDGDTISRIQKGYQNIQMIRSEDWGAKNGECFRCPYRKVCRMN